KKNDQIAKMNNLLGSLNSIAAGAASKKADEEVKLSDTDRAKLASAAKEAGITLPAELTGTNNPNKGQLDGFIQTLKSQIDSLSNTQQMDMLRLQSLSNKRNEAFEIMTNFIKKFHDANSSIVGNMR